MAVVDVAGKTVTLKIVYFGCALGGKTTNLVSLHRLTDPANTQGMTSIATTRDRTLFFDLLPVDLGQIGGMQIKAHVYTVPGQVHYETTRRQVLAGVDGVVLVVDSSAAQKKANAWAVENLRFNLKANALDPDGIATVLQWNKRDLPDARPIEDLRAELNKRGLHDVEAVATTGAGVVETFATVLLRAILNTYVKHGQPVDEHGIRLTLERALGQARSRQPDVDDAREAARAFQHRVDVDRYGIDQERDASGQPVIGESSLLSESVRTNMKLAEQLDELEGVRKTGDRQARMMQALATITPMLTDASKGALPRGILARLLQGCDRERGSMLLFPAQDKVLQEREVLPEGRDVLNSQIQPGLGSLAYRLAERPEVQVFDDLGAEVFFEAVPPEAEDLASALFVPLTCDGTIFGVFLVYSRIIDRKFDQVEQEYWSTAAALIGLSLHWRTLRTRLTKAVAT